MWSWSECGWFESNGVVVEEKLLNKKPLWVLRSMGHSGHVLHTIILIGVASSMEFVSLVDLSLGLIGEIEPLNNVGKIEPSVVIGKCINDGEPMEDLKIINGL